jgi:lysophospholipase L1-like esterase
MNLHNDIFYSPPMRLLLLLLLTSQSVFAQQQDLIDTSMLPFWKGKIMYNESVMMVSREGKPAEARLLFKPKRIISVKNSAQNITYEKGKDWDYKDGKLILLPGSRAIFMTDTQLYPDSTQRSFPKKGGGRVVFNEGSFFHEKQLAVSYKHKRKLWNGPVPKFESENLPHSTELLKKKQTLKLLLNGDSIAAGANASGRSKAEPNLPDWGALIAEKLRREYKTEVKFTNTAVGGMDSKWGVANVGKNVTDYNPDLVILAFGMNDGTGKMAANKFRENITGIIEDVRKKNKNAEFILVATMLPNPESLFEGTQRQFKAVLEELTGPGITLVDMTAVHDELLKHKSYQDLTGNNINHPNDFLIRWYAQEIVGQLIE